MAANTSQRPTANRRQQDRIAAGQPVSIPIRTINRSTNIWGPDAKEFKPQRWLEEGDIQGKCELDPGSSSSAVICGRTKDIFGKGFPVG